MSTPEPPSITGNRETFTSRFGLLMTMIGVAVGLGNVWRFPYMVGRFGGAPFVLFYVLIVVIIGIPALMSEWTLGRLTRRGPVGAFARAGLPFGRQVGWFFFVIVIAATGYYTNALGWVLYYAMGNVAEAVGISWDASAILPPDEGFSATSFFLQVACTGTVILACAGVLLKGLRSGIEVISKAIMPMLLVLLFILIARSLTLPGAGAGVHWYLLKFDVRTLTGNVMLAAMGQAIFSLSLGGTFMVVYGSYLNRQDDLRRTAVWTATGDVAAGLLAGFAIFPAVFALGLEPASGPGLIFFTLPQVFEKIPAGWLFALLFFLALFGAAYLSDVAAFEVLVAGLTDNTRFSRKQAVWLIATVVFLFALPPMINMKVFVPWDLTFGSGMQSLGALLTVITVAWVIRRSKVMKELSTDPEKAPPTWLYYWLRFVIPGAIILVGIWWFLTDVLGIVGGV
ncbi:MAG: sodium-dependent transporter [Rhodothermales bacterium]